MSNILHPDIYGGYFPKIGSSCSQIKYISGVRIFPNGPVELQQAFEAVKRNKVQGSKIYYHHLINAFERAARRYQIKLNAFSWQKSEEFIQQLRAERFYSKNRSFDNPFVELRFIDAWPEQTFYK